MALLGNAPNFVRTPQNPCTGQDFWREPSGAHEATGLSTAAGTHSPRRRKSAMGIDT